MMHIERDDEGRIAYLYDEGSGVELRRYDEGEAHLRIGDRHFRMAATSGETLAFHRIVDSGRAGTHGWEWGWFNKGR